VPQYVEILCPHLDWLDTNVARSVSVVKSVLPGIPGMDIMIGQAIVQAQKPAILHNNGLMTQFDYKWVQAMSRPKR
jgi:hypothetical protein